MEGSQSSQSVSKRERLAAEWVHMFQLRKAELGRDEAFASLQRMAYPWSLSTLYRHEKSIATTGYALDQVGHLGPSFLLGEEELQIVADWVRSCNDSNDPLCLDQVRNFVEDTFGVIISRPTACRTMERCGMSIKTCMTKTSGFILAVALLKEMYWGFIRDLRARKLFVVEPFLIRSLDTTYTSQPKRAQTTYSEKGGGKQRSNKKVQNYTDGIVTMVSGDGFNHTPCLCFTFNPTMAPTQKDTARGRAIRSCYIAALRQYGISENRIIYTKSTKYYVGEKPEMYEEFLTRYEGRKLPKQSLILHDGGRAFQRGSEHIFKPLGFDNHVTYPAAVHQFLSPNDNKLHGCKATWHKEFYSLASTCAYGNDGATFKDSFSTTLRLMQLLDIETLANSQQYFRNNLFNVMESDLDDIIKD